MADVFSQEKRSEIMRAIRSKNTKAEVLAFRYLKKNGVYFQKHYSKVPGKPDIALPRKKIAVFIDGDFWHGKTFNQFAAKREDPDQDYWVQKIRTNIERDLKQNKELEIMGWKYIRVWEKDIMRKSTRDQSLKDIELFLKSNQSNIKK